MDELTKAINFLLDEFYFPQSVIACDRRRAFEAVRSLSKNHGPGDPVYAAAELIMNDKNGMDRLMEKLEELY